MFEDLFLLDTELRNRLIQSLVIVIVLWLFYKLAVRLITKGVEDEIRKQYHWRKAIEYTLVAVGFLLIGNLWVKEFQSVTTFLGLLSAGIAIALKDVFLNIAGWAFIYLRKPFDVGDRIQVGDIKGDVIDLRMFQFSLLEIGNWVDADQSTGRVYHLPNGLVFTTPQANYSQGFNYIWNEQTIYVSLDSNYKKAKSILLEILNFHLEEDQKHAEKALRKAKKDHLIVYKQYSPVVFMNITERGIQLSMRYLCDPKKRRMIENAVTESLLDKITAENTVKIAYPISTVILDDRRPPTPPKES